VKLIERKVDMITGSSNLEDIHSMSKFPVFMGCVEHSETEDIFAEMTWQICKDSGFIQLKKLVPLDVLYHEQHHSGAIGQIWKRHHCDFSNFLSKNNPTSVFEIGGAHGILSKEYKKFRAIPWTILEPNPAPIEGCDARFIKGFFDDKFFLDDYFDTVVHSHVFEHMYEPNRFMMQLSSFIDEGKKLVFSLPNMKVMLERNYTNCINFEHSIFLTEPYVEFMLSKHGFRLLNKEYFMDNHSIFYSTIRDSTVMPIELPSDLYIKNKLTYANYIDYHKKIIFDINSKISNVTEPIYLFGAHVFAQYLIGFGLNVNRVLSLLDNDPAKQGRRLYGTNLMVQSPKILHNIINPIVILKAGVYNSEIKKEILENINSSVVFLE
jgi:hypothetical protein